MAEIEYYITDAAGNRLKKVMWSWRYLSAAENNAINEARSRGEDVYVWSSQTDEGPVAVARPDGVLESYPTWPVKERG